MKDVERSLPELASDIWEMAQVTDGVVSDISGQGSVYIESDLAGPAKLTRLDEDTWEISTFDPIARATIRDNRHFGLLPIEKLWDILRQGRMQNLERTIFEEVPEELTEPHNRKHTPIHQELIGILNQATQKEKDEGIAVVDVTKSEYVIKGESKFDEAPVHFDLFYPRESTALYILMRFTPEPDMASESEDDWFIVERNGVVIVDRGDQWKVLDGAGLRNLKKALENLRLQPVGRKH